MPQHRKVAPQKPAAPQRSTDASPLLLRAGAAPVRTRKNSFNADYERQKSCLQHHKVAPQKPAAPQRSTDASPLLLRAGAAPGQTRKNSFNADYERQKSCLNI